MNAYIESVPFGFLRRALSKYKPSAVKRKIKMKGFHLLSGAFCQKYLRSDNYRIWVRAIFFVTFPFIFNATIGTCESLGVSESGIQMNIGEEFCRVESKYPPAKPGALVGEPLKAAANGR